jgi:5-methylcytosine-specific restriction endonuclease McrA
MSAKLGTKADSWKRYRARHLPYVEKQCCVCGLSFKQSSNVQKRCDSCRTLTCAQCQAAFIPPDGHKRKFCSWECKCKSQSGSEPEHLAANRGVKPRTYHIRHRNKRGSAFDREWRIAVFERDDYTCQLCFVRGGRLQADHIKPFSQYPELRYDLSNGRTLCAPCHQKTDTYGYRAVHAKRRAK